MPIFSLGEISYAQDCTYLMEKWRKLAIAACPHVARVGTADNLVFRKIRRLTVMGRDADRVLFGPLLQTNQDSGIAGIIGQVVLRHQDTVYVVCTRIHTFVP